jgi:excisionase family DNA binding protein
MSDEGKKMDAMTDEGGLLTVRDAAKRLKCGIKKIYELDKAGKLDIVKLGHSSRVTETSLRRLIAELPRRVPADRT